MGKEESEVVRFREMEDIIDEEKIEMISNLDRREVDFENKTVTPGHKRCTKMKGNRRIIFPGGKPAKEEVLMDVRLGMWMGIVKKYYTEETKEGVQNSDQLTKKQMMGRKSVQLKVKKGQLHISSSDKGKGIISMDRDTYVKMAVKHTKEDIKVEWKELEEAQRTLRSHGRCIARIFGLREKEGPRNRGRYYQNLSSWAGDASVMRATAKTHKKVGEGGVPASRSILGASKGLTTLLGKMLLDLIVPITMMKPESRDSQSTEEVLRSIEDANIKLKEGKVESMAIGSMDVKTLYP